MTVFPRGKHDNQVDSTAQFFDWFKRLFPGQGIFEYYRQLAEEVEAALRGAQPIRPQWAIGSVEWLAEQNRS